MKKSELNKTKDYHELMTFGKEYFIRFKIKSSFNFVDVVHDIIVKFPDLGLEQQKELFTGFYNNEKKLTHRIGMCERDMDRERISVRDTQREFLKSDKNRLKHNKANKIWHHDERIDNHEWAHLRDVANADYQKGRYNNEEAYRLKKNEKDRLYYAAHHPKPTDDNRDSGNSATSVNTLCRGVNVITPNKLSNKLNFIKMSNSKNETSPEKGNQVSSSAANGKREGKSVAQSNAANHKGVFQYGLLWLFVSVLLFIGRNFMKTRTVYALRNILNESRPKGWTKERISFLWFKKLIVKNVYIPFNLNRVLDASKATGALFSMARMNKFQYRNFVYMLMAMPTPENVITGIIGKIAVANRAIRAKEIIDACAVSTWVTILPADIVIYRGHLATFVAAIDAPKKAAWKIVMKDLKILLSAFQLAANNDQPNAISILESGSFKIKQVGGKKSQVFDLTDGAASGTVNLIGEAGNPKKKHLHDWFISLDGGLTWTRLQPTINSETLAIDLPVGKDVWFAHQIIDKNGIVPLSYAKKNIIVK
jgi:hypothetical protein